jgi:hypothetical protein
VGNAAVLNASGPTVNSSTGAITVNLNSDIAWVDNGSSVLTRTLLPTGSVVVVPAALPTSGGYMNVGIYIQSGVWSSTGTLITAAGSQQSSQANALAAPPSTPADSVLLEYCIIQNSAGAYLLAQAIDSRTYTSVSLHGAGWQTPTPLNSWGNYGAGYSTLAYRISGTTVRLKGTASGGATNTEIFQLPVGYWPTGNSVFGSQGALPTPTAAGVQVFSTGQVYGYFAGSPLAIGLDGITFTTN